MELSDIQKNVLIILYNHKDGLTEEELFNIINTPELLEKEIKLAKYKVKREKDNQ